MSENRVFDESKWNERNKKLLWGMDNGYVFMYSDALFDRLRPYNFGGLPLSIMLFTNELCNGHCYDRAKLMQLAFPDSKVIWADIESLRNTGNEDDDPEHAFVETKAFGEGKTWIVDTSVGLIFDKDFYWELEKPKINMVFDKKSLMKDPDVLEVTVGNFDEDKYILPASLPFIIEGIKNSNHVGTVLYREKVLEEIENFKTAIGYDEIEAEIDADLKLLKTNPNELDKKFGIVRDERGREISRNGKPNQYYISPEEWDRQIEQYRLIENDPEQLEKLFNQLEKKARKELKLSYKKLSKEAKVRFKEILNNPTINFYEMKSYSNERN